MIEGVNRKPSREIPMAAQSSSISLADQAVFAACAGLAMFVAGYSATRVGLDASATAPTNESVQQVQYAVVPHQGTLWAAVGE